MRNDTAYLRHTMECLDWIEEFVAGGKEEFFADRKTQSAVLRELQVMAEPTQRPSEMRKAQHPEVFWKGISGFRNVLVHDYLGIKAERVWQIVQDDLPVLRSAAEGMLTQLEGDED